MEEDNNFEAIVTTWRRLSGELPPEPALFPSMGGDTGNKDSKKVEDLNILAPEKNKIPVTAAAVVTTTPITSEGTQTDNAEDKGNEEKHGIGHHDNEDKEGAGDSKLDDDKDYLEDNDSKLEDNLLDHKPPNEKIDKDKVDSVFLRRPPPHKVRSSSSTAAEEEGCGMKCLYYTLQCCDCVLM